VAPVGAVESALAGIWQEVLGVGSVGRYDNFFDLGGDSILALQIAARAGELGSISVAIVFENQTVAQLATALGRSSAADGRSRN
jgi:hypothetical protein